MYATRAKTALDQRLCHITQCVSDRRSRCVGRFAPKERVAYAGSERLRTQANRKCRGNDPTTLGWRARHFQIASIAAATRLAERVAASMPQGRLSANEP